MSQMLNVIWCEEWVHDDGPRGVCRDLGSYEADEVPSAVRSGYRDASRYGWGVGLVAVTDALGNLLDARRFLPRRCELN